MTCDICNFAELITIHHLDGTTYIYICHNQSSKDYGRINSGFYECDYNSDDNLSDHFNDHRIPK